jgi:o-succinylbenzoate synthase
MCLEIQIIPYTLQFNKPAGTSRGTYLKRKVWYIKLIDSASQSHFGIGECAPLPNLSCDDIPNYETLLLDICKQYCETHTIDYNLLQNYPSILFGLESAIRNYEHTDSILWDTPFAHGREGISINGLIWMGNKTDMLHQIEQKIAEGYKCLKLKIGAIDFEEEFKILKHIRSHYTAKEIELRVDANGAFTTKEALSKLNLLATLDLHSIEQPIAPRQIEEMAKLCATTPLPIALDEELIGVSSYSAKQALLETIRPQYIILKPSLHGGIYGSNEWIECANKLHINWWITSALESNIGLNVIAQWCASLQPTLPQGLGTGMLYKNNIESSLIINKHALWIKK